MKERIREWIKILLMPKILLSGFATLLNSVRYGVEATQRISLEGAGFPQILPLLWPSYFLPVSLLEQLPCSFGVN